VEKNIFVILKNSMMNREDLVEKALKDFKSGKCVLVYDWPNRENEIDTMWYAGFIDVEKIYTLRKEAGGLICYAVSEEIAKVLGLPFQVEMLKSYEHLKSIIKKPSYGEVSPFSIWINSIDVKTGISDEDRVKTIRGVHEVVSLIVNGRIDEGKKLFYEGFYSPGHVPILIAKNLNARKGHTELAITLAKMAGLLPSVVFAEMLTYGKSMSLSEAKAYAEKKGLVLITGEDIISYIEKKGFV
jgi:3,4-dihydroxy-2-butanone 4-phosphate synthase